MGEIGDLVRSGKIETIPAQKLADSSRVCGWAVELNASHNLPLVLPYIQDGQCYVNTNRPIRQGEENHRVEGLVGAMIAVDGPTLLDLLKQEGVVVDLKKPEFVDTPNYDTFSQFLIDRQGMDGGYAHVLEHGTTARIQTFGNSSPALLRARKDLARLIPADFLQYGRTQPLTADELHTLGTKTLTSALIARAYSGDIEGTHVDVNVVQIKLTAYGYDPQGRTTAVPRLIEWGENGMKQDLIVAYVPGIAENFYIAPEQSLVLLHRQYAPRGSEGVVQLVQQNIVTGIEPVFLSDNFLSTTSLPPYNNIHQRDRLSFPTPPSELRPAA